ncbi:hypothetical protein SNE40_020722 [Patella caerulea]|uniref:PHD-type domain-containing protein n=1 Tax=Patella caerulea TaxID=87958 RepID=A0AAN8J6Y3_PATCE
MDDKDDLNYSFNDPTNGISKEKLRKLHSIYDKAVIFTTISEHDIFENINAINTSKNSSSDTDSDQENDDNVLPEPITSLYDPTAINLEKKELIEFSEKQYHLYTQTYPQKAYDNLCEITKTQSLSTSWMLHRAGRITASTCFKISKTQVANPSKSLIKQIMQYEKSIDNKYIRYGKNMEPQARTLYSHIQSKLHQNLTVVETGFHVKAAYPFLGASPDGLVSCSGHPTRVLETKCPFKYKDGLVKWEEDKDFPLNKNYEFKTNHPYYYQIQLQLFICNIDIGDFFIFTPSDPSSSITTQVVRNNSFLENLLKDLRFKFMSILLPEIVSRAGDDTENARKVYCSCQRPSFGQMIACDSISCKTEWYHYACVNITRAPKHSWFCSDCKSETKI